MKNLCRLAMLLTVAGVHSIAIADDSIVLERYVAIDNVCAWPNLTRLPDGTIIATIFNQPSHGSLPGDVECWASSDGRLWQRRGTPAAHDPHTNRMNVAAGLAGNGDLLVLASGWSDVQQPERPKQAAFRDAILRAWVCRSSDGARTWTVGRDFPPPAEGMTEFIPFGDIQRAGNGSLRVSVYAADAATRKKHQAWMLRSEDDGRTWAVHSQISGQHNETTVLPLADGAWLAAARYRATDLFRSTDDGRTWQGPTTVTKPSQINGHLLRLADGSILLSFGDRIKDEYGVHAAVSTDEGATWSEPVRIARTTSWDCGYPSSAELADGTIVTAYYAKSSVDHHRYHMAVAIWRRP